jgi:DNA-binding XRE family transcriptional regulator
MDGDVFAGLRHQLGVSQERLAAMLDVHPVTVNKWERVKRPITRVVELAMWGLIFIDKNRQQARPARGGGEGE